MKTGGTKLPLANVKVLELEGLGPSNLLGMILADHGAQVTIISSLNTPTGGFPVETNVMHRGKRSVVLDLKSDGHKIVFEKLIKTSDVIIDPFKPITLSKLGFPIERLSELNPKIIIAKLSSYGMNSKLSNHAGHDGNFASLSGVLDTMNAMDSTKPVFPSIFVGDVSGVTIALSSILMALLNKAKGYEYHQFIDVSYAEAVLYLSTLPYSAYQQGGLGTRTRKGFANGGLANYNYYSSKEGDYFMLGSVEYKFFLNFLLAIGLSPEFISTLPEAEKIKAVQAKMSTMTTSELTKICIENPDTCLTPFLTFENNNFLHEHNRPTTLHTSNGVHFLPATRISTTKDRYMNVTWEQKIPARGQHNLEVVRGLNLSPEETESFYKVFNSSQQKL